MKTAFAAVIGILALLLSACVTGDEITSYVIKPDGSIEFSIYRHNLTSDETREKANEELANYISDLEQKRGPVFSAIAKANTRGVQVTILRRTSSGSVLITGSFLSLDDFAADMSEENEDQSLACTAISRERVRGIQCESTWQSSKVQAQSETTSSSVEPLNGIRFALAEGSFTKAEGFILAHDKRSAILDDKTLSGMWGSQIPSIAFSLEWQIPEAS